MTPRPGTGGAASRAPSPLHPRAAELIRRLALEPHPEGGWFREVFRSELAVRPLDGRPPRPALTTIHFLLARGQHSRWHRVSSDEAWHFAEGEALELRWLDRDGAAHRAVLSGGEGGGRPLEVVPAGCWQSARPLGAYALVGCTVGPGFDFADFELAGAGSDLERDLDRRLARDPAYRDGFEAPDGGAPGED